MGRSVYVPSDAAIVAYIDVSEYEEDFDFDDLIDNIAYELKAKYPSFEPCKAYIGREGYIFLSNMLVKVGISEYCGLASVFIVPEEEVNALALNFANKIEAGFIEAINNAAGPVYKKIGSFSNGEGVFEKVKV